MSAHRRILFICKKPTGYGIPAGLFNSAQFMVNALREMGYEAKLEFAIDGNCIDRLATEYDPTHVILEALWCPPIKLRELLKFPRHSARQWIVRLHSKTPFLAQEGIAIEWIREYYDIRLPLRCGRCVVIAPNSRSLVTDLRYAMRIDSTLLPNIYAPFSYDPVRFETRLFHGTPQTINIGCFGAVRPLKNQLQQAMAAIMFANEKRVGMKFHINGGRVEDRGESALKSMRSLFKYSRHELVEHGWLNHVDFLRLVRTMDLGMQVSFSESFNIVAADFAYRGVPMVVSPDVEWMPEIFKCSPTSSTSIVSALRRAWWGRKIGLQHLSLNALHRHNADARAKWKLFLEDR